MTVIEGRVDVNPYGNWSDVDHGIYIGHDKVADVFMDGMTPCYTEFWEQFVGKRVRLTVEVLPREGS